MRLTIVTDKLIYKYKDSYYTTGGFLFQITAFKEIFNEIEIVSDIKEINNLQPQYLKFDENIKFINLSGNIFKKAINLRKVIQEAEFIHIRLPSKNGYLIGYLLNHKAKGRVSVYVGGHPENGIIMAKGDNLIYKVLGKISGIMATKVVKKFNTFVTGQELKEYFLTKNIIVEQIISTSIKKDDILPQPRLKPINNINNIIFIGRLSKEKGIEFLLDFIKNHNSLAIEFHIVGEGPLQSKIVNESKNDSRIKYHGGIYNRQELFSCLRKTDILLLPSLSEGTPKVILEAMSQGVPVIATRVGGIPSIINNKENGLLFEAENSEQLLDCINSLLNTPELYKRFSEEGIKLAKKNSLESLNKKLFSGVL